LLARDLGIAHLCDFMGAQPHNTVLERLRLADVFVLTSRSESFGVATAEAMAAGLPVIVTDGGASPELVEDQRTGFVVPVSDVEAIADRIGKLVRNEPLRRELGFEGRRKAAYEFSIQKHHRQMHHLWESALSEEPNLSRALGQRRA
jgi:glycosyltransferase involved in cell wall biosynthesis